VYQPTIALYHPPLHGHPGPWLPVDVDHPYNERTGCEPLYERLVVPFHELQQQPAADHPVRSGGLGAGRGEAQEWEGEKADREASAVRVCGPHRSIPKGSCRSVSPGGSWNWGQLGSQNVGMLSLTVVST
jgi:hypothetical protein